MKSKVCILLISFFLGAGNIWAQSGELGDGLTWKYEGTTLTISKTGDGSGVIPDYNYDSEESPTYIDKRPWYDKLDAITKIVIGEGVTKVGDRAFSFCSTVTSISLPSTLISIGEESFVFCEKLTQVTLPSNLKSIEHAAFYSNGLRGTLTIPEGITTIGIRAFGSCLDLTAINVSSNNKNFKSINDVLFSKDGSQLIYFPCGKKINSYNIPEGVKIIDDEVFANCSGITIINIPSTLESYGFGAFSPCPYLTDINVDKNNKNFKSIDGVLYSKDGRTLFVFPSRKNIYYEISMGVTTIFDYAFFESRVKRVTIPKSVTDINKCAFTNCKELTVITLNCDVPPTLGDWALDVTTSLISIRVPSNLEQAYKNAPGWSEYANLINAKTNHELGNGLEWIIDGTTLIISKIGDGLGAMPDYKSGTTEHGRPWGGLGNNEIKNIIIEDGVTYIGSSAFKNFTELTKIEFRNTIETIGDEAFYGCVKLTNIDLPSSLKNIGEGSFGFCSNLTSISFPKDLEAIGDNAFSSCASLNSLPDLPENIDNIGKGVFSMCGFSGVLIIPEGIKAIGELSFSSCDNITSVFFPSTLTTIGARSFAFCRKITGIIIPENVETIGDWAFTDCGYLSAIIMKNPTPPILEDYVFPFVKDAIIVSSAHIDAYKNAPFWSDYNANGCIKAVDAISEGDLGEGLSWKIDGSTLTITKTGEGSGEMPDYGYFLTQQWNIYKNLITNIVIGEGVKNIGTSAFYGYHCLTNVIISETVLEIKESAFGGCINIETIISKNTTPPAALVSSFYLLESLKAIHVPIGSGNAYKAAPGWSQYAHLIQADATGLEYINKQTFLAYPNPTSSQVTISGIAPGTVLRIYTFSGALLGKYTSTDERITIDISNLAKGIYLIKTDDGFCKIIKN